MDYHKDRFEDYSLMVFKDEKLVAVLPANRVEDKLFSHQGLTYGGLVISKKLKLHHFIDVFKTILKFLDSNHFTTLNLKLIPSIYTSLPSDELDYLLFLTKSKLYRKDTLSVVVLDEQIKFIQNRDSQKFQDLLENMFFNELKQGIWNYRYWDNGRVLTENLPYQFVLT